MADHRERRDRLNVVVGFATLRLTAILDVTLPVRLKPDTAPRPTHITLHGTWIGAMSV